MMVLERSHIYIYKLILKNICDFFFLIKSFSNFSNQKWISYMAEDEQVYIESVESRGSMQNVVVFIIIVISIELCFKKKIIY